ncbi:M48 family metalloprotease [Candidatus Bathyarchaeota archaeon]|nr:M48 family metalloprotease [Candidatus Bathyarchaeota archaeon]
MNSWTIESIASECAATLSLDNLPTVILGNLRQANALTTGTESSAVILVDRQLAEKLSESEMRALLGHEMGHIKSHHLMYHSIAELLERGISFSGSLAGIGVISLPLRLALLSWHRESELSADRAGLIVAGSLDSAISMFMKVVGGVDGGFNAEPDLATVLAAFQCHPQSRLRVEAMRDFAASVAYSEARRKLELRNMLEDAFSEECRFCGSPKDLEDLFCPSCGRALA